MQKWPPLPLESRITGCVCHAGVGRRDAQGEVGQRPDGTSDL